MEGNLIALEALQMPNETSLQNLPRLTDNTGLHNLLKAIFDMQHMLVGYGRPCYLHNDT
jgi:hypothetical protein